MEICHEKCYKKCDIFLSEAKKCVFREATKWSSSRRHMRADVAQRHFHEYIYI